MEGETQQLLLARKGGINEKGITPIEIIPLYVNV